MSNLQITKNTVIAIAAAIAILMVLFPPWSITAGPGSGMPGVTFNLGYYLLFAAPNMGVIDFSRLLLQWILVGAVATAIFYFLTPIEDLINRKKS